MNGDKTILEDEKELKGWLVALNGPFQGRDYRFFAGKTIVGSSHLAGISIPAPNLEPYHFSIRIENEEAWLTDLDSESGLFIDGKRIWREPILDEVRFQASGIDFLIKFF